MDRNGVAVSSRVSEAVQFSRHCGQVCTAIRYNPSSKRAGGHNRIKRKRILAKVVTLVWMDFNIPRWNVMFSFVAMAILDKNNQVEFKERSAQYFTLYPRHRSCCVFLNNAPTSGGCCFSNRLQLKVLLCWWRKNKTHLIALSIKRSEL